MTGTRTLLMVLILTAGAVWSGCGGDDGGGGTGVVAPATCIDFAAASQPAGGSVVTQEVASSCESVTLDVVVSDATDLFAASFTVNFDPTVVDYEGLSIAGSVLASGGTPIQVLEQEQAGQVTIGLSRLGVDSGVDVVGAGKLIGVVFRKIVDLDTSDLSYSDASLLGSETPPVAKPAIQWKGGTLIVQ